MKRACVRNVCIYGFSLRVYTTLDENRPNIEWDSKGMNQTILPMSLTKINFVWKQNPKSSILPMSKVETTAKIPSQFHPPLSLLTKIYINVILQSLVFQIGERSPRPPYEHSILIFSIPTTFWAHRSLRGFFLLTVTKFVTQAFILVYQFQPSTYPY
jgi:hypothetical protein